MRGKRVLLVETVEHIRIIPARAGQTALRDREKPETPDHPRACGANRFFPSAVVCAFGSSPRVRGKQRLTGRFRATVRIIPARAGQTASECCSRCRPPDHPRACGANLLALKAVLIVSGSSPRVRGKLAREPVLAYVDRIIPARAGQTRTVQAGIVVRADHPRACGANFKLSFALTVTSGSSPRVRGKHHGLLSAHARRRIIPARAGQTNPRRPVHGQNPDHPRACGANWNYAPPSPRLNGSSPRVRGKQPLPQSRRGGFGSSPRVRGKLP